MAKRWHMMMMRGLTVPNEQHRGCFRGEPGQERLEVRIGSQRGVAAANVTAELIAFQSKLRLLTSEMDATLPPGAPTDEDQLTGVLAVCAWAHSEWIRIHPFANGNGRTARLWVNCIAMRYGLPPFLLLRPRPGRAYGQAAAEAMRGQWKHTIVLFRQLLDDFFQQYPS